MSVEGRVKIKRLFDGYEWAQGDSSYFHDFFANEERVLTMFLDGWIDTDYPGYRAALLSLIEFVAEEDFEGRDKLLRRLMEDL
jgi:hypothetical protein